MPGEALIDHRLQTKLDLAIVQQAVRDLWLRTDGFKMTRRTREECIDLMLDAAHWLFVAPDSGKVFSFRRICERCGLDPMKAAVTVFAGLPDARRREIWRALRHYRNRLLPLSWQACGRAKAPKRHPKGTRYVPFPTPEGRCATA